MGKIQNTACYPARLLCRDLKRIRVAVAGLGKMGAYHAQAVQRLARGEAEDYYKSGLGAQTIKLALCGLCDPCAEKAEAVASDIPWFADWQDLLTNSKPDLVIIATPTQTHFDLAVQSLEAGIHTFVEKPLVTKRIEFKQLNKIASEQGCRLMSGHVERYNPVAIKIRAMLTVGQLVADGYRFQRTQPHDARIADDIVTDKIVHDLDLAQYFFGAITDYRLLDSKRVNGRTQEATVRLRHANGIEGTLFVSWLLPDERKCREVRITCKDGIAAVGDFAGKTLHINERPVSCAVPSWVKPDNNQIKDELADFVAYCLIPDLDLPVFKPLLQISEIETSVTIIEALIKETEAGACE